jgi:hypothetical protein
MLANAILSGEQPETAEAERENRSEAAYGVEEVADDF